MPPSGVASLGSVPSTKNLKFNLMKKRVREVRVGPSSLQEGQEKACSVPAMLELPGSWSGERPWAHQDWPCWGGATSSVHQQL